MTAGRLSCVVAYAGDVERRVPLKRTAIARGTTELRRVPLARTAPASTARSLSPQRSTVPPVSARRKKLNRELAKVVAEKRKTVRYCQAHPMIRAALLHPGTTAEDFAVYTAALKACHFSAPTDAHHLLKRSRGSDETFVSEANIILCCTPCNTGFIEAEPRLAERAGLLIPSSAVRRIFGRIA